MARKEITTPLDLKNMDNHNYNYDELYGLIDETDRRISEDMWEEIKDANTIKMLEPVQTAADLPDLASLLPSEEADKSLITVIDEQRVYSFVNGKWQPFSEIDLDPFEPFKDELAEIVAAYEKQIQNITQEVQATKDSAIESINQTQTEVEGQISTIRDEMTTQASDLTALFNDSMDKLTSKQDTALAEVDSAKQAAITALEGFNNTDTSNWQKYKMTNDDGSRISEEGLDLLNIGTGYYETWNAINDPLGDTGTYEVTVIESLNQRKVIHAIHSYSNRYFVKTIHSDGVDKGWKELTGMTRTVLFEGSASNTGDIMTLNQPYSDFTELRVKIDRTGGNEIFSCDAESDVGFSINYSNVFNDNSEGKIYEMGVAKKSPTELEITSQRAIDFSGAASDSSGITILKIWGIT